MARLLVLGLVFTLWSLAVAAPTNKTEQHKGIVFPKKTKINATEKPEEPLTNPISETTPVYISSTEVTSESSTYSSPPDVPPTEDEKYVKSENIEQEDMHDTPEEPESDPDEDSHQEPVDSSEVIPGYPLPPDNNDGLIEYNLGNPLALRLHLPWWPLKDMLKSIQDAISVMNLTMKGETLEADNTKTKIVQFDDRNYTLKVRVFRPHEDNKLLVRLISLTPIIEEGKIPTEKGVKKVEDEEKNEALQESQSETFPQMKKLDDDKKGEEEKEDDDDDDDDDKKGEKKKAKDSKKEKQNKKKKESKKGSDSEE